jgi:hypothetical protein
VFSLDQIFSDSDSLCIYFKIELFLTVPVLFNYRSHGSGSRLAFKLLFTKGKHGLPKFYKGNSEDIFISVVIVDRWV